MISYSVYKVVHLVGILMVFLAVGAFLANSASGHLKQHQWRKSIAITHGIGLFLSLLGGFGLLARLGIVHGGLPNWVLIKLCIWGFFGIVTLLISRKPIIAKPLWYLTLFLGALAAYLAGSKPF